MSRLKRSPIQPRPKGAAGFFDFLKDRNSRAPNIFLAVSIVIPVLVRVVFASTRVVPWWDDTVNVASDFFVGYVPAWVVYYLVSWRPRRQDRDRALVTVGAAAIQVAGQAAGVLSHLRAAAGDPSVGSLSERELAEMVKGLTISSPVPSLVVDLNLKPATVGQMFGYWIQRTEERAKESMRLAIFLDSELLVALLAVEENSFFQRLRTTFGDLAVSNLVPNIYEYLLRCDELRELLCRRDYKKVLDGVGGLSIQAVADEKLTSGPLIWRAGSTPPADWDV